LTSFCCSLFCASFQLQDGFLDEILLMADVIGSQDNAFAILYDDFIKRGYDAHVIQTQLQYDDENPSGIPTFSTGELAPLLEGDQHEDDLEYVKGAANFKDITNPMRCQPGECHESVPFLLFGFECPEEQIMTSIPFHPIQSQICTNLTQWNSKNSTASFFVILCFNFPKSILYFRFDPKLIFWLLIFNSQEMSVRSARSHSQMWILGSQNSSVGKIIQRHSTPTSRWRMPSSGVL
jgi:hypothetical protein